MAELIVQQIHNLCNYYILPFIKRSQNDFKEGKFVASYLDLEAVQVVVEVEEMQEVYKTFAHYSFSVDKGFKSYIFYDIPEQFHTDVAMFMAGKYSQFSDDAKIFIRKYSKLPYSTGYDGKIKKSVWFHVLDKSNKLRISLEEQLGEALPVNAELASRPHKCNFFDNN